MDQNLPSPTCTVYDWCSYTTHQRGHHMANLDLIEMLDEPDKVIEVNLYADDTTPPVVRVMFPGDGVTAYIDLPADHAGSIASIIRMFEGPGLFDRRGLRELAELLTEAAHELGTVTAS
ncbi:MAG TPA: hypothetical protein VFV66_24440 [Nonomuraea sp.]|nr:hypothetical protein [Nonomuraea sp.]